MNNGELTAQVARVLARKFNGRADVLFDHGDKKTDGEEKVGVIRSWFGDKLMRDSLLADLDIAVVLPDSNRLVVLIEIEESSANPKTLLGDVFATLFGDHITFQGKRELVVDSKTILIVLAHSKSDLQAASHISGLLQARSMWNTRNSCVGQIVVEMYQDSANLEAKLVTLIEHAIINQKS